MSETEPFRLRWIIECLGVNRTGSLLFVGQIPDEIYSHSKAEGIACYQVDTIEQAAAQFAQPHSGGESNHDDLLTLVLQVDPGMRYQNCSIRWDFAGCKHRRHRRRSMICRNLAAGLNTG